MPKGRPRKPAGQQQGHRAASIVRLRKDAPEVPEPPAGLLAATVAKWVAYWASRVSAAAEQVDRPALERLFRYYDDWERCMGIYREAPVVEGSMGQPVVNPMGVRALALEEKIRGLEAALGLTPYDRQRLGIAIGQAQLTAAELNRMAKEAHADQDQELEPEVEEAGWEEAE